MNNQYVFSIGDEVITVDGQRGKIVDICKCESCRNLGFYEPTWVDSDGNEHRISHFDATFHFYEYYKIGKYYFNTAGSNLEILEEG